MFVAGYEDLTAPPRPELIVLEFVVPTLGLADGIALLVLETGLSIAAELTFLLLPSLAREL